MEYPPSPTTVKGVKLIQQAYRVPAGAFGRLQFLVMKDTRASDKISAALNIDITNVEGVRSFVQHVKTNLLGDHFKMDLVVMSLKKLESLAARANRRACDGGHGKPALAPVFVKLEKRNDAEMEPEELQEKQRRDKMELAQAKVVANEAEKQVADALGSFFVPFLLTVA